jgi:N-acetylmuramoyl-L-alanine amidase
MRRMPGAGLFGLVVVVGTWGCAPQPGQPLGRTGDEIVVCGRLFHTGTPVVTWLDPGGYDTYRIHRKFEPDEVMPSNPAGKRETPARYGSWRYPLPEAFAEAVRERGWTLEELQEVVDLFVIHYDVCGTSRRCFKVLHDLRGLSVQFMLDVDGTIYQTLDLKERAWHAGKANSRSVGVEIANIGAYPDMKTLSEWYGEDETGALRLTLPSWLGESGIRTVDFVARPAMPQLVRGVVQGRELYQYNYTPQQYESLIKLTAALCRVFPKLKCDAPRDENGAVINHVLNEDQYENFAGLLGHWHVTRNKIDPGPAFDWFRVLNGARRYLGQMPLPVVDPPKAVKAPELAAATGG